MQYQCSSLFLFDYQMKRGDIMLDELKEILSSLYCQLGLTEDILRLSQVIDELINQEMK